MVFDVALIFRPLSLATLHVRSSVTADGFYRKLGYVAVGERFHGTERTIMMEKRRARRPPLARFGVAGCQRQKSRNGVADSSL